MTDQRSTAGPSSFVLPALLADRYRVDRELGSGGMATVFLADDTRHRRRVAIKVLQPELSAVLGPDRFLKEIELTANLQHPHILPLFDSGAANGLLYYVMPFVEGETLRQRLTSERQLPVAEAVRIASEVADALEYAHAHGVVHRDIKPENVLLQDGHALVADFGIALAVEQAGGARMTQTGMSLGTPQYMAPEQAMGERNVDRRADIYALGVVTYEMLAGEPPFTGPTAQAIVARVMTERPRPLLTVRDTVPPHVESAVGRAIEKLPADRFASAAEFRQALHEAASGEAVRRAAGTTPSAAAARRWRIAALVASGLAVIGLTTAVIALTRQRTTTAGGVIRFTLDIPRAEITSARRIALSGDGRTLAWIDPVPGPRGGIWVRPFDRDEAEQISGTSGARRLTFSPDGRALAFLTQGREVRVVPRLGGTPLTIARGADSWEGIEWGTDGFLYFIAVDSGVIARVPAGGGTVELVSTLEAAPEVPIGFRLHRNPVVVGDGRAVLFSVWGGPGKPGDIGVVDLRTRETRVLREGRQPLAVHDGHLLFHTADGVLRAQRFDVDRLTLTGDAIPLMTGIEHVESSAQGVLSGNGTLAYLPAAGSAAELVWVSRSGAETSVNPDVRNAFDAVAISPQGDRIALSIAESDGSGSIWLYDVRQETMARFAQGGALTHRPRWTPDGDSIVFVSDRGSSAGVRSLWIQPADGSDTAVMLIHSARHAQDMSFSPDGWIAYREGYDDGRTLRDIRYVRRGADTTSRAIVATRANEEQPAFSPNGRWLAYSSNESGREDVYVRPFPGPGGAIAVSSAGGKGPVWSPAGRELFYRDLEGQLVAVTYGDDGRFTVRDRRVLFDASSYLADVNYTSYDVTRDGQRFLFIKLSPQTGVQIVVDWWSEAREKLRR